MSINIGPKTIDVPSMKAKFSITIAEIDRKGKWIRLRNNADGKEYLLWRGDSFDFTLEVT